MAIPLRCEVLDRVPGRRGHETMGDTETPTLALGQHPHPGYTRCQQGHTGLCALCNVLAIPKPSRLNHPTRPGSPHHNRHHLLLPTSTSTSQGPQPSPSLSPPHKALSPPPPSPPPPPFPSDLLPSSRRPHHLHHLHLRADAQVVQEHLQVLLHLDAVVVHLGHREDAHPALPPHLETGRASLRVLGGACPARGAWGSHAPAGASLSPPLSPAHPTLCWRSRNGSSMSMPPSCTIHHTSMQPPLKRSWFCGNESTFLATSRAWCAVVVSRTVSVREAAVRRSPEARVRDRPRQKRLASSRTHSQRRGGHGEVSGVPAKPPPSLRQLLQGPARDSQQSSVAGHAPRDSPSPRGALGEGEGVPGHFQMAAPRARALHSLGAHTLRPAASRPIGT